MNLSYALVPNCEGNLVKLPREPYFTHHVRRPSQQNTALHNFDPGTNCMVSHASNYSESDTSPDMSMTGDEWYDWR